MKVKEPDGISVGVESGSDKISPKDMKKFNQEKKSEKNELIKNCGLEISDFYNWPINSDRRGY